MKKYFLIFLSILSFYPYVASAQSLFNYVTLLNVFIARVVPLIIGIALVLFLWGIARFMFSGGDEKVLADTKRLMVWGITALFVMVSIWGIIEVLQTDLFGTYDLYSVPIRQP